MRLTRRVYCVVGVLMLSVGCLPPLSADTGTSMSSDSASTDTSDMASEYGITKLRVGIFAHNKGLVASRVEHGTDANGEVVTEPVDWLFNAEPTYGLMLNGIGNTSYLYAGYSWELDVFEDEADTGLFVIPFFGLTVHNGKREPESKRRGLGCRVLFREAIEVGWRFSERWALSILTDHLSHGGFCEDRNQGLDNTGIRFHWRY